MTSNATASPPRDLEAEAEAKADPLAPTAGSRARRQTARSKWVPPLSRPPTCGAKPSSRWGVAPPEGSGDGSRTCPSWRRRPRKWKQSRRVLSLLPLLLHLLVTVYLSVNIP
ncbi:hypothetical protein BHE74_00004313 [Ensete ventricosum]|nr:hypothetical protein BHE74_00004313 [Ensete ventricosum]